MFLNNFILLLCLLVIAFSLIIYQSIEINKVKNTTANHLKLLSNQIIVEENILKANNKEVLKIEELEKDIKQKLVILKTDLITLDFSLSEFFELAL